MERTQATRQATRDLANEIYEQKLRAKVETEENIGKIISIDNIAALGLTHIDKMEVSLADGTPSTVNVCRELLRRERLCIVRP